MELDLIKLREQLEAQLEIYEGKSETFESYLGGKIDLLKDLITLGFSVAK